MVGLMDRLMDGWMDGQLVLTGREYLGDISVDGSIDIPALYKCVDRIYLSEDKDQSVFLTCMK
jgi:hypothetical protein